MTNKQKTTMHLSLLPIGIIVVAILVIGFLLFKNDLKFLKPNQNPTIRRLANFPQVVNTDKPLERQRRIITNQQELADFLNYVDSTGIMTVKDNIDFNKEVVLAVSSETYEESGHTTKIAKVSKDDTTKKMNIIINDNEMGKNCIVEKDSIVAVDIVAISKTDYRINFEKKKIYKECDVKEDTTSTDTSTDTSPATSTNPKQ